FRFGRSQTLTAFASSRVPMSAVVLKNDDLFGFAILISRSIAFDRIDLKRGRDRRNLHLLLTRVMSLCAALCRAHAFVQLELHEIFVFRKRDRRTSQIGQPTM